jgi:polyphosphate kinase
MTRSPQSASRRRRTRAPDAVVGSRKRGPRLHLTDPSLYLNRELSWLKFNARVLMQARDASHPLLERVKFLAIAAANLDEFYMVRVASLLRRCRSGLEHVSADGLDIDRQVKAVRHAADAMLHDIGRLWSEELRPLLADRGIRFLDPTDYTADIRTYLDGHFNTAVCPVLTPLAFDPGHPFPYISNRSQNVAAVVRFQGETRFARVKVPNTLRRFVEIPAELTDGGTAFAFLEDLIVANLRELFPGVPIVSAHLFRVIRDTDLLVREQEADDLMESVARGLRDVRRRPLSLLHLEDSTPQRVLDVLVDNFDADSNVVVRSPHRLGFADWLPISRLHRAGLRDRPLRQRIFWHRVTPDDLFDRLKYQDVLVHHPYDSFATFENFLRSAVRDPKVLAIKMTLYRLGSSPRVVDLLLEAADRGKQVSALVELKARFDEQRNIEWAARLEDAGVHVTYGVLNLKTHCKACLVVRTGANGIERYAHLGTGNYNRATTNVYTDLGMFTSDPRIMADLSELFNVLTGYSNQVTYRELGVAPVNLRRQLDQLIRREADHARAGRPAGIVIKVNSLTDPGIIRSLYRASQAGVPIELIVRGMCMLRPGVAGVSDTIQVRSIVGRFLEHSRILSFENGGAREVYLSSADLMERNLNRRVEVAWPIRDATLAKYLRDIVLDTYLRDTHRAMFLRPDGEYERSSSADEAVPIESQRVLMDHLPPHAGADDDPVSQGFPGDSDGEVDWRLRTEDGRSSAS